MITTQEVEIDAPAEIVWEIYSDVERWPEWTTSVERVVPLDGAGLAVGKRFEIKQPRLPRLVWEVDDVEVGTSWTWTQRSPGGTTVASHELIGQAAERTLVRTRLDQRGPVGAVVGALTRRLTRRYLETEAQGLKTRSEQRRQGASPA